MAVEGRTTLTHSRSAETKKNKVSPAAIKKWVPPYTAPGKPDLFYINQIISAFWLNPDGSLPRLGNPDEPLNDLVYLMLTRRPH
ncbi:MAG: hypothetical protein CVU64_15505 [Deltaproteobacteria bacterium HGW-Deltaproteobacteria-21]|nr:MAG: hypothetical protein CVU64_15505 [Deltaproteobacteria bacterium HGW-Deltaproteobacteria-21]